MDKENINHVGSINLEAFAKQAASMSITAYQAVVANLRDHNPLKHGGQRILERRLNPIEFFRQLFANPTILLKMMRELMVVLSGSRAADYFVPGSATA